MGSKTAAAASQSRAALFWPRPPNPLVRRFPLLDWLALVKLPGVALLGQRSRHYRSDRWQPTATPSCWRRFRPPQRPDTGRVWPSIHRSWSSISIAEGPEPLLGAVGAVSNEAGLFPRSDHLRLLRGRRVERRYAVEFATRKAAC